LATTTATAIPQPPPPEAQVKEKRTAYYLAWMEWLQSQGQDIPEGYSAAESVRHWDETVNDRRLALTFGTQSQLAEIGLMTMYRQFVYNYSHLVCDHDGKAVMLSNLRTYRDEENVKHFGFLTRAEDATWTFSLKKLKATMTTAILRVKLVGNADRDEAFTAVIEAFNEAWPDTPIRKKRKAKANGKAN